MDELARRGHRFHRVVTATTRPPRENERDGVDYFFLSEPEFQRLIDTDGLLEHAEVYGRHYGVPEQQVLDELARGNDVYVRTDVQGAASIKRMMPEAVLVFIAPSSVDELEARIRARGSDGEEQVRVRLETARREMARAGEFAYVLVNEPGKLERTADMLAQVVEGERARP